MLEEKTTWYYIGNDLQNSFIFFLSKINDDYGIIITNKDTEFTNVYKVKTEYLLDNLKKNKIRRINCD